MSLRNSWQARLGESYWLWRLYHFLTADVVSIQRVTKFSSVFDFLGDDLGMVADLGCGPGVFLRYLCSRAVQVYAADIDLPALRRVQARHRDQPNLSFLALDASQLPFRDGCLDTMLFLEILEHMSDDGAALEEVRRILRPGGRLVLSVPVPPGEVDQGDPWGHKREGYKSEEIFSLLRDHAFQVIRHRFAVFRFSRLSDSLVRHWRRWLHLPAPFFLTWVCYLDFLLDAKTRQMGGHLPACIVILARKNPRG